MKVIRNYITLLFFLFIGQVALAEEAYEVTAKAWKAMGLKDWNAAVAHADRALKTWGVHAKQTNAKLNGYAPAKDAKKYFQAPHHFCS